MEELTNLSARIVFMGTPKLSRELLETLIENGYTIVGVVTKPDAPQGRQNELVPSPVRALAEARNIPVLTPEKLDGAFQSELKALKPDLIVVAAYGKILPEKILTLPSLGCLNVHYSLLPRFRGASPIQHALLFGDTETGVTLIQMDKGLDTGSIIGMEKVVIDVNDTTHTLTPKLNAAGQNLLLSLLPQWIDQSIESTPQPEDGVVLCQLIERADGKIEWTETAEVIYNRFRAFDPWPGIFTYWKKDDTFIRIKLLSIRPHTLPVAQKYQLGEVFQLAVAIAVQTGSGVILLSTIQPEGKGPMAIGDFINGNPDFIGGFLV